MSSTSSIRTFLVDDHPIIREGFRDLLENEGDFSVVGEAGSGEEALEMLSQIGADLAIVDISLEGTDGIELARRLTEDGSYQKEDGSTLKVLMVSMHEEAYYVENAFEAGARGYVLKENVHTLLPQAVHAVSDGELYLDPNLSGSPDL